MVRVAGLQLVSDRNMRVWARKLIFETRTLSDRGVVRAAMVRADWLQLVVRADRLQLVSNSNRRSWEPEIVSDRAFHGSRILGFVLVPLFLHLLKLLCDVCLHFHKMLCAYACERERDTHA
jgi:hypothetical protein